MMKLTLPFPPSANLMWKHRAYLKNGKPMATTYLSTEGKEFKAEAARWLEEQKTQLLSGSVSVILTVFFPSRRGDLDNRIKPTLDVLQGVCFANDSQVEHIIARRELDPDDPRMVVTVAPHQADLFGESEEEADEFAYDIPF